MTTFIATGSDLHDAAAWVSRAIPAKPSVPVLAGMLLDAGVDDLTLTAFDYEVRMSATIAATVTVPGRMLASGRLLTDIAKTVARDVNITISDESGQVVACCGRSEWTLPALDVGDYPGLPELGEPIATVNAGVLRHALARVLPAVARDSTLEMLTGVRLEGDGDTLTLVGTDRYRLAVAQIGWQPTGSEPMECLVPASLLDSAARMGAGDSETLSVSCGSSGFGLSTDSRLITGRLLAVDFPRWRQLVASPGEHHAVVDSASLSAAVGQVLVAMRDGGAITLAFDTDEVAVAATGDDRKARAVADLTELAGEPITVAVNPGYLRDGLAACGDKVTVHFGATPVKPLLLTGSDDGFRYVLVPVRLP